MLNPFLTPDKKIYGTEDKGLYFNKSFKRGF